VKSHCAEGVALAVASLLMGCRPDGGPPPAADSSARPATGAAAAATSLPACRVVASLRVGRYDPSVTALGDGRVIVAGGRRHDADDFLRDLSIVDPKNGKVTAGPPMRVGRALHAAIRLADGRVLVAGGWTDWPTAGPGAPPGPEPPIEVLAADASSWQQMGEYGYYGNSVGVSVAKVAAGKVLLTGGDAMTMGRVSPDAVLFDPARDTIEPRTSMNEGRANHLARVGGDGSVHLWGGHTYAGSSIPSSAPAVTYRPDTDAWTPSSTAAPAWWSALPAEANEWKPILDPSAARVTAYISERDLFCYASDTSSWRPAAKLVHPRRGGSGTRLPDGTFVVAGGVGDGDPDATIELCSAACVPPP
jgi:hypothetical protein